MKKICESKSKFISSQCKLPGRASSRSLQMHTYNCILSCHPLLESDDAVFHILKGAPQEVKAETTSHVNLCSSMKLIKKKSGEQADYLCIVYSMGYKFFFVLFLNYLFTNCWLSNTPAGCHVHPKM